MNNREAILSIEGLTKEYAGKRVVDDVTFSLHAGEIIALLGENGAGKSTLKNMLVGLIEPTLGTITFEGVPQKRIRVGQSGITAVHQELSLFDSLTVAENICILDLPGNAALIDWRACESTAEKYLNLMQIDLAPNILVSLLGPGERQLVEIAKALRQEPRVLILDEPTASLTAPERRKLFSVMQSLKKTGIGMIFITHFIDEVYEVCNRIFVLRNGSSVGGGAVAAITRAEIEELMVGRSLSTEQFDIGTPAAAPVLSVNDFDSDRFAGINFTVHKSEILGIAGLMGAGRTELAESIFGLRACAGTLVLNGRKLDKWTPGMMKAAGTLFISEDRRNHGIFPTRNIKENISSANLDAFVKRFIPGFGFNGEKCETEKHLERYNIAAPGVESLITTLSGGNQQKSIFARWMAVSPSLCIFDDPTRGVDIGAKEQISKLIAELARSGVAIILISSDINELIQLSHRILVMRKGRFVAEVSREQFDARLIVATAASSDHEGKGGKHEE